MILGYCSVASIPKDKRKRYGDLLEDVRMFAQHNGAEACEIDISPFKDARSARASYYNTIRRAGLADLVGVQLRSGRLFLVRKEALNKC